MKFESRGLVKKLLKEFRFNFDIKFLVLFLKTVYRDVHDMRELFIAKIKKGPTKKPEHIIFTSVFMLSFSNIFFLDSFEYSGTSFVK